MTASSKSHLREEYLSRRLAVPVAQAEVTASRIAQLFQAEPRFVAASIIGGYMPIRSEINILPLLTSLHAQGNHVALPVTQRPARELSFRLWHPRMEMVRNAGIEEPPLESEEVVPDLFIVPLLCYDAEGHRVGYGGGYFDRMLAHLRTQNHRFHAVGVAYAFQQTPSLMTADVFDERLDAVITEKSVQWFA